VKVIVIGAGVVGLTMAYELCTDGHEVSVVERHEGAADETSFGNAGLIAPAHSYTWASPRPPKILVKSLFRRDEAVRSAPPYVALPATTGNPRPYAARRPPANSILSKAASRRASRLATVLSSDLAVTH